MSSIDLMIKLPSLAGTDSDSPSAPHIFPANSIQNASPAELLQALVSFVSSRFVRNIGHLSALHRHPTSPRQLHHIFNKRIRCDPRFGKGIQQTPLIEDMIEAGVKGAIEMALKAFHEGLALNVVADIAGRLGVETITRTFVSTVTSHPITLIPDAEVFGNLFEDAEGVVSATPDWRGFTLSTPGGEVNVDVESRFFPGVGRKSVGDLPNVSVESSVGGYDANGAGTYAGSINVALWAESRGAAEESDEEWDFNSSVEALYLGAQRDGTREFEGLVHVGSFASSLTGTSEMSEDGSADQQSLEDIPDTSYEVVTGRAAILDRGPEE